MLLLVHVSFLPHLLLWEILPKADKTLQTLETCNNHNHTLLSVSRTLSVGNSIIITNTITKSYPDLSSSISSIISFKALGLTFSAIKERIVPIVSTGIASSTQNPSKHFFKTERV